MDGKDFGGWTPDIAPVTGDADYVAKFVAPSVTRALLYGTIERFASESITFIGREAFNSRTNLVEVDIPNVLSVSQDAFKGCTSLVTVTFPKLGSLYKTFSGCTKLETVYAPVATTMDTGFYSCDNLKEVYLPSLTTFYDFGYYYKSTNKVEVPLRVHLPATPPKVSNNSAFSGRTLVTICIPTGSLAYYEADAGWSALMAAHPTFAYEEEER
jgi:hypothetical protein